MKGTKSGSQFFGFDAFRLKLSEQVRKTLHNIEDIGLGNLNLPPKALKKSPDFSKPLTG
ncbi:MAG: hypothetical protein NTU47_01410 [Ignavibacteriales bacterium]|nr:hypothetical protein [Ignavibacteriales bacterium]